MATGCSMCSNMDRSRKLEENSQSPEGLAFLTYKSLISTFIITSLQFLFLFLMVLLLAILIAARFAQCHLDLARIPIPHKFDGHLVTRAVLKENVEIRVLPIDRRIPHARDDIAHL